MSTVLWFPLMILCMALPIASMSARWRREAMAARDTTGTRAEGKAK